MSDYSRYKLSFGMFLGMMAAVSCAPDKKAPEVSASAVSIEDGSLGLAASATRVTAIACEKPQIEVIDTIDRHEKVDGGNDWYNDFFTPLAHHNGYTYWVRRDKYFNVFVSKIDPYGHREDFRLGGEAYQARRNSHNLFSLAVDQDGYVHVTGDMQNGPNEPPTKERDKNLYPDEYRGAMIMYWRSRSPENVSDGFEFRGQESDERRIPAYNANGIRFFKDNNGVLYSSAAVKAITGKNIAGSRGIGLYRYHSDSQTWETIGAPLSGDSRSVFFSEYGSEGNEWFNGYFHSFMFDKDNRMHFATPVATTKNRKDYDRIIYAYSDDGGNHWKKMNDKPIEGFPLRGADGETNQGDVVGSRSATYSWQVRLVPDQNGRVGIRAKKKQGDINVWWVWDGSNWTLDNSVNNQKDVPHTGSVGPGGTMILYRNESPLKMQCADAFDQQLATAVLDHNDSPLDKYNKLLYVDEFALRMTGSVYAIAGSKSEGVQSLVKITYRAVGSELLAVPKGQGKKAKPVVVNQSEVQGPKAEDNEVYVDYYATETYPLYLRLATVMRNLFPGEGLDSVDSRAHSMVMSLPQETVRELLSLGDWEFLDVVLEWNGLPPNNYDTVENPPLPAPVQKQQSYADLIAPEFLFLFESLAVVIGELDPYQSRGATINEAFIWVTQYPVDKLRYLMNQNDRDFRVIVKAWHKAYIKYT